MAEKKKSVKRKVITAVIVLAAVLLLIGSFFLRDICLRAGITECEKREILQVKTKYSEIMNSIISAGADIDEYTITATHKGLFEKSAITPDENGEELYSKLTEEFSVLCHSYCYGVSKHDGAVYFSFNASNTKQLIYTSKEIDDKFTDNLGDNWYYYEKTEE